MKTKDLKKKSTKATGKTIETAPKTKKTEKKALSTKAVAGKKTTVLAAKTAKQGISGTVQKSVKNPPKKKPVKAVQKPPAVKKSKPAGKTVKAVMVKAKVSKVSAVKPKPAVAAEKKTPIKKVETVKVNAKEKPKSKTGKISAIRPKPAVKTEKKVPKKAIVAKVATKAEAKIKAKTKPKAGKVTAVKPKPVVKAEKKAVVPKKESAVPVMPSLKSVLAASKYEKREEPKPKAERYPVESSRARLKIFLPEQHVTKEEPEEIFFGGLPEEYGENAVIALAVDPNTVFVDWEVIPKDISAMEGDLNLRFYDITGIEFNDWNANAVFDIPINKRVGNDFFDIRMPGRDVVVAVGILNAVSGFMPIVRSDMISFPELLTFDELGIVQKLFESGIPVGY